MTYHMESVAQQRQINSDKESFSITPKTTEKRVTFPERLWECLNDEHQLIRWSAKGDALLVDEERFEDEVMTLYPGLVAISSYSNFRRQLRAYNFEWYANSEGEIEFVHPYFKREHPELVGQIQTKRKSSGVPPRTPVHPGSGDKMASVGRRQNIKKKNSDFVEGDEFHLEEGEIKVEGQPKPKRKYMRRKRKASSFTTDQQSPNTNASPSAAQGFQNYGDRPPAGPYCSCPWHCPVSWDSYEGMMQNWTKSAPPPGYWYPPPYPPHQPHMGQPINQGVHTNPAAGVTVQAESGIIEHSTTSMTQLSSADQESEKGCETPGEQTSSCAQTVTTQTEQPFPVQTNSQVPPMGYPMGPDPWRFQQMGGGMPPFYQGMPYGLPMMGPQRPQPYQSYPPHMQYQYMMEGMQQQGEQQQQLNLQQSDTPSVMSEVSEQTDTLVQSIEVQTDPCPEQDVQANDGQSVSQEISMEQKSIHPAEIQEIIHDKTPIKIQRHDSILTAKQPTTPSRSTIQQYLKRRQDLNSITNRADRPQPVDKPLDEFAFQVSTEQLISNVGIQQQNMMVLMNQPQQHKPCEQSEEAQNYDHNGYFVNSQLQQMPDGQVWAPQHIDMQTWQQLQSQQMYTREEAQQHWAEENQDTDDAVSNEDVMLEVEVSSQDSQCSGPLDLSSSEVTIVTMGKNIPVTLAAVVQDDDTTASG